MTCIADGAATYGSRKPLPHPHPCDRARGRSIPNFAERVRGWNAECPCPYASACREVLRDEGVEPPLAIQAERPGGDPRWRAAERLLLLRGEVAPADGPRQEFHGN